jgi:hypothetical protein
VFPNYPPPGQAFQRLAAFITCPKPADLHAGNGAALFNDVQHDYFARV